MLAAEEIGWPIEGLTTITSGFAGVWSSTGWIRVHGLAPGVLEVGEPETPTVLDFVEPAPWWSAQVRGQLTHSSEGRFIVAVDGVIFDQQSPPANARECFDRLAGSLGGIPGRGIADPGAALSLLRGTFRGFAADHLLGRLTLFTDSVNSRPIYYFAEMVGAETRVIFASTLKAIAVLMRQMGKSPSIDSIGARELLSFGFMLGERTLLEGVSRLRAGSLLVASRSGLEVEHYRTFDNTPDESLSRSDAIDLLDATFVRAVDLEFGADVAASRTSAVTLSGGLDSRLVLMTAAAQGYERLVSVTASIGGYRDQTIAQHIARDHQIEHLTYQLDSGHYLMSPERAVVANDGMVFLTGSAHMVAMMRLVDLNSVGLLHTGMLGDAVMGTYLHGGEQRHADPGSGATSPRMAGMARELGQPEWSKWPNDEMFLLYSRGFNGVLNGFHSLQDVVPTTSPFLDPDFVAAALRIPADMRWDSTGSSIYRAWIKSRHPKVAKYRWERTGLPPSFPSWLGWAGMKASGVRRRLIGSRRSAMVDLDGWLRDPVLRSSWDARFAAGMRAVDFDEELRALVENQYASLSAVEQGQALTLLLASQHLGVTA